MAKHKLAYITASTVAPFLTGTTASNLIKGTYTQCRELALERLEMDGFLLPDPDDVFLGDKHTERGHLLEPEAIQEWQAANPNREVHSPQQVFEHSMELWSCTVDSLIDDNGILEIKCPTRKNHMGYVLEPGSLSKAYKAQLQFQLWISGREYACISSYCPLVLNENKQYHEMVVPDKAWQDFAQERLELCEQEIKRVYEQLSNQ